MDPHNIYCGRVRLSRLAHWHNSVAGEVEFNRFEFSISLSASEAQTSKWLMQNLNVLLSSHVQREFIYE